MAKGSDKQRAKKKQQKREQRKKKLARRDGLGPAAQGRAGTRDKPVDLLKGWKPEKHGITGLAHRRKLALTDAAGYAEMAQKENHPGTAALWTPARIAELTDDAILTKLAALGVATDRDSYLAATADDVSAMPHAATPWASALPKETPAIEVDFVQLAALDLWRRWRPERPSREMLLVAHQRGWDADFDERPSDAVDLWLEFGEMIWKALPNARRMEDIDAILNDPTVKLGAFYFESFADMLAGVASDLVERGVADSADRVTRVVAYLRETVARLPDTARERVEMIEGARSNLLDASGRRDEALAVLRGMIDARPDRAAGYAMLSEALLDKDTVTEADLDEAIGLLRRGVTDAKDAADWTLEDRMEGLERERAHLHAA